MLAVAERQIDKLFYGQLEAVVPAPASDLTATVESIVSSPGIGRVQPASSRRLSDGRMKPAWASPQWSLDATSESPPVIAVAQDRWVQPMRRSRLMSPSRPLGEQTSMNVLEGT